MHENVIHTKSFPRAAIAGNPSDGYGGKAISFVFDNFEAQVKLNTSNQWTIKSPMGEIHYADFNHLLEDIATQGFNAEHCLILALIKRYYQRQPHLDRSQNLTLEYKSSIPRQVGLAGSSAIITAALKALNSYYDVSMNKPDFAQLVLDVEKEELDISAGLQDRIAQAFEVPVFMDLATNPDQSIHEKYQAFSINQLPKFFIAYSADSAESSDVVHNNLSARFKSQDPAFLKTIEAFRNLTDKMFSLISTEYNNVTDDLFQEEMSAIIEQNFKLRKSICQIKNAHQQLVDIAKQFDVSTKFTGSGGAVIGILPSANTLAKMTKAYTEHNIKVIFPNIVGR